MAMRRKKSGERVLLGLHLGIYLTFGSDLGRIACGMIAWFGSGWITFYEEGKKHHFRRRNPGIETSTALRETFGRLQRLGWKGASSYLAIQIEFCRLCLGRNPAED